MGFHEVLIFQGHSRAQKTSPSGGHTGCLAFKSKFWLFAIAVWDATWLDVFQPVVNVTYVAMDIFQKAYLAFCQTTIEFPEYVFIHLHL